MIDDPRLSALEIGIIYGVPPWLIGPHCSWASVFSWYRFQVRHPVRWWRDGHHVGLRSLWRWAKR